MIGRNKKNRPGQDQARDTQGRFAETGFSRADSIDLGGDDAGFYFDDPECAALREDAGVVDHALGQASRFEDIELPPNASALEGAVAEAAVSSLWSGQPGGPLAPLMRELFA